MLENKNLFDNDNIDEVDFYNRYRKYETDRLVSVEQYESQRIEIHSLKMSQCKFKIQSKQNRARKKLENISF